MVGRAAIDPDNLAASYLTGSTLVELAECHGVSASTIKRVLRELGTRKYRNSPKDELRTSAVRRGQTVGRFQPAGVGPTAQGGVGKHERSRWQVRRADR